MKIPKAVSALSSIDDDLIIGAETFRRPKKTVIKWAAATAAAVICLVLGISIPLATRTGAEEAIRSGLETVENPVYDVVVYTAPETYESSRLYAATTPDLAEYDEHMCRYNGESFTGKGLRVFNFTEGATDDDFSVWYLYFIDGEIYRIYYVSKYEDKFVTAWTEGGDLARAIEAL
ncbi:MAG: hypothetical protein IKZ19_00530, partial [Clostridia bacterium]|nr:hypothetical protein [Clostridia bacterium]